MIAWSDLKHKISLSIVFGVLVAAALTLYGDVGATFGALQRFRWQYIPVVLTLTLVNYGLRFVKWHYYLQQVGAGHVSLADSVKIFVAGFVMVLTPGKVGELYKAWALKETNAVAFSRAAPIVLAERLTDGLALAVLASAGLLVYQYGLAILIGVLVLLGGFVVVVQVRPLALWLLEQGKRLSLIRRFAVNLHAFYDSTYRLLGLKNLIFAVVLGVISWATEGVALYLILIGLGLVGTPVLAVQAVAALALSTIVGAISFLPGGLGAADGSLTGLLVLFSGLGAETAVAATLLVRLATLWFAVALGGITILSFRRELLPGSSPVTPYDAQPTMSRH